MCRAGLTPHTHHSAPAPWAACSSRARRRAALRTTSRQRAEGAAERSMSHSRTQRRSTPAGWSSMPMARGEAMGKPGRGSGPTPQRGIHRPTRSRSLAPLPHGGASACLGAPRASGMSPGSRGPAGPPPGAAVPPHNTETVPTRAAYSLRATERAVSRGIRRGFCTGRPRRPMWTVTRDSDQALLGPG